MTPMLALRQAPEHVEGEEKKDLRPLGFTTHILALIYVFTHVSQLSGLATYVLVLPSPRACRGEGSEEHKKHVERVYQGRGDM
jgi:hypothetical protein